MKTTPAFTQPDSETPSNYPHLPPKHPIQISQNGAASHLNHQHQPWIEIQLLILHPLNQARNIHVPTHTNHSRALMHQPTSRNCRYHQVSSSFFPLPPKHPFFLLPSYHKATMSFPMSRHNPFMSAKMLQPLCLPLVASILPYHCVIMLL